MAGKIRHQSRFPRAGAAIDDGRVVRCEVFRQQIEQAGPRCSRFFVRNSNFFVDEIFVFVHG